MMNEPSTSTGAGARLVSRLNRRTLVQSGALLAAGGLVARAAQLRTAAQDSPELQTVLDDAITLEAFAVTFYGVARNRQVAAGLSDVVKRLARTAQCEEEAHYNVFAAGGGTARTETFTIDAKLFADEPAFLTAVTEVEAVLVAGQMAATRAFAALGELDWVEIAFQIGAVEAQHLALARAYLDARPPNDRAFAQWRFNTVGEAVAALTDAGYIGGTNRQYTYPGPVEINCRSVFGLVPETTEAGNAATPEPAAASPIASASPAAAGTGATPKATPEATPDGTPEG